VLEGSRQKGTPCRQSIPNRSWAVKFTWTGKRVDGSKLKVRIGKEQRDKKKNGEEEKIDARKESEREIQKKRSQGKNGANRIYEPDVEETAHGR